MVADTRDRQGAPAFQKDIKPGERCRRGFGGARPD